MRAAGAISLVALLIALTFGQFAFLAFPVTLLAGLVIGLPIALLLKKQGWTAWWFSMAGGIACSLPLVIFYLGINPGHTAHVGLYNSMYALGMGALGGLIFWFLAVFRNAAFSPTQTDWPKSLLIAPVILIAFVPYRSALEPESLYGCITSYQQLDKPTAWEYSVVSVLTDEGVTVQTTMTKGYSNPEVIGNCAWISRKKNASLSGFTYSLHTPSASGCQRPCPNSIAEGR